MALIKVEDQNPFAIDTAKVRYINISRAQSIAVVEIHANYGLTQDGDYEDYRQIFRGPKKQAITIFNQILEIWYKEEIYVMPKARKVTAEDEKDLYDSLLYIEQRDVHMFVTEQSTSTHIMTCIRNKDKRHYFNFLKGNAEANVGSDEFNAMLDQIGVSVKAKEDLKKDINNRIGEGE